MLLHRVSCKLCCSWFDNNPQVPVAMASHPSPAPVVPQENMGQVNHHRVIWWSHDDVMMVIWSYEDHIDDMTIFWWRGRYLDDMDIGIGHDDSGLSLHWRVFSHLHPLIIIIFIFIIISWRPGAFLNPVRPPAVGIQAGDAWRPSLWHGTTSGKGS